MRTDRLHAAPRPRDRLLTSSAGAEPRRSLVARSTVDARHGQNSIGTHAAATRRHPRTCAAAPLRDPAAYPFRPRRLSVARQDCRHPISNASDQRVGRRGHHDERQQCLWPLFHSRRSHRWRWAGRHRVQSPTAWSCRSAAPRPRSSSRVRLSTSIVQTASISDDPPSTSFNVHHARAVSRQSILTCSAQPNAEHVFGRCAGC